MPPSSRTTNDASVLSESITGASFTALTTRTPGSSPSEVVISNATLPNQFGFGVKTPFSKEPLEAKSVSLAATSNVASPYPSAANVIGPPSSSPVPTGIASTTSNSAVEEDVTPAESLTV